MHSWNPVWHQQHVAMWLIVIVLAVLFGLCFTRGRAAGRDTPKETLKRRYARGEIDQGTYERMLQELRE